MDAATQIPAEAERRRAWRAPTEGEDACVGCGASAGYGWGASWFCAACVPAGFLPKDRPA